MATAWSRALAHHVAVRCGQAHIDACHPNLVSARRPQFCGCQISTRIDWRCDDGKFGTGSACGQESLDRPHINHHWRSDLIEAVSHRAIRRLDVARHGNQRFRDDDCVSVGFSIEKYSRTPKVSERSRAADVVLQHWRATTWRKTFLGNNRRRNSIRNLASRRERRARRLHCRNPLCRC